MPRWGEVEVGVEVSKLIDAMQWHQGVVAAHRIYSELHSVERVRMFMETHVFAVWDFMSLLSAIRNQLTCVSLPWVPTGTADVRRFVNELFLAEDSDLHPSGDRYTSHFELYLEAMRNAGAETSAVVRFTDALKEGASPVEALVVADVPEAARPFVESTWRIITKGSLAGLLGAFTFGRENLIPSMFSAIRKLAVDAGELGLFVAYLDRHIELDGDEHAPVAFRMVDSVCARNPGAWEEVLAGGREALFARSCMWDSLYDRMRTAP